MNRPQDRQLVRSVFLIYFALLIIPGACYAFYLGFYLVSKIYSSANLQNFWLIPPFILIPYCGLALALRWGRAVPGNNLYWPGVAFAMCVATLFFAHTQLKQLLDIPVGIRTEHKDSLLWDTVLLLYCAGCFAGTAVLLFPSRSKSPFLRRDKEADIDWQDDPALSARSRENFEQHIYEEWNRTQDPDKIE